MKIKEPKPRWGWLYAIFGLMVVLFYEESKLGLTGTPRMLAQLGILALVYYLTDIWIGSNLPFDRWS